MILYINLEPVKICNMHKVQNDSCMPEMNKYLRGSWEDGTEQSSG